MDASASSLRLQGIRPTGSQFLETIKSIPCKSFNASLLAPAVRIGSLGAEAQPAVRALGELLHSENVIDRHFAARALGQVGPAAKEAVPLLVEALGDADGGVCESAVEAIQEIDPKAVKKWAA